MENEPENIQFSETCQILDNSQDKGKTVFLWRQIPAAEKCELCGQFAVEYEINHVGGRQILRRCQSYFNRMRQIFSKAAGRNAEDLERQSQPQEIEHPVEVS